VDRTEGHTFHFGASHQGRKASCLVRVSAAVVPNFLALVLLFPKKAVDGVRRAHDGDSRFNPTAQRRLALLGF
jgi:hypothetical protein